MVRSQTAMTITTQRLLDLNDVFPCPVCRHGQIQALVLTEAFACGFCRHILSADLPQQTVKVIDSNQAIAWIWNGHRWRLQNGASTEMSAIVLITAGVLTIVPASIVWLSGLLFPPLTSASSITFPMMWAFLTFLTHLGLVLWLVGEHYQIPFYVATKFRLLYRRPLRS